MLAEASLAVEISREGGLLSALCDGRPSAGCSEVLDVLVRRWIRVVKRDESWWGEVP